MDKNIEKEFKILVNKEQFAQLMSEYEPLQFKKQLNIYYDTKDASIEKKKGAMRIRTKNNTHIFTLKMHSDEGLREYECEVEGNDISYLNKEEILSLLREYDIKPPFIKTASLLTERAMVVNEYAELCFDISHYNDTTDYEIEYEFKKEHDGLSVFNGILKKVNLQYKENCKSKIQRALNR